jgi:hypothetical protein
LPLLIIGFLVFKKKSSTKESAINASSKRHK